MRALLTRLVLAVVLTVSGFAGTGAPFAAQTFQGISDPRSYTGLQAWYDVSDVSSMRNNAGAVPSTGEGIKLISDKSGNSSTNAFIAGMGTGNIAYLTTGTAVGTGDFTVATKFRVPPTAPAAGNPAAAFSSGTTGSASANSLIFDVSSSYNVLIGLYGSGSPNFRYNTYGALLAAYVGQDVTLTLTRVGATWTLYLNGAVQSPTATNTTGGTPPAFTDTVNSQNMVFGCASTGIASTVANFPVFEARAYSAALDAAGVLADYNGTVQANNFVNVNFGLMAKLATAPVATSGQTITVTSSGATGARISGARDLYQGTAANQPILTIAAGGNYLTFDGSNDYLKAAAFSLSQPETVYFVGSQVTWTNTDSIFDGNADNSMRVNNQTSTPGITQYYGGAAGPTYNDLTLGVTTVLTAKYNGASSFMRFNRGANRTNTTAGANNANGFTLAAAGSGATPANITVGEVIVFATADATAQQNAVIGYLARKWSISGGFAHMPPAEIIPFNPNIIPWKRDEELAA